MKNIGRHGTHRCDCNGKVDKHHNRQGDDKCAGNDFARIYYFSTELDNSVGPKIGKRKQGSAKDEIRRTVLHDVWEIVGIDHSNSRIRIIDQRWNENDDQNTLNLGCQFYAQKVDDVKKGHQSNRKQSGRKEWK